MDKKLCGSFFIIEKSGNVNNLYDNKPFTITQTREFKTSDEAADYAKKRAAFYVKHGYSFDFRFGQIALHNERTGSMRVLIIAEGRHFIDSKEYERIKAEEAEALKPLMEAFGGVFDGFWKEG
jgi:hypothetical protein